MIINFKVEPRYNAHLDRVEYDILEWSFTEDTNTVIDHRIRIGMLHTLADIDDVPTATTGAPQPTKPKPTQPLTEEDRFEFSKWFFGR